MRVIKQAASRRDRPRSLHEVAERTRSGQPFDPGLREFLDEFYSHPERRQDMISDEPCAVGVVQDAYLAAVAKHLAECWRLRCPDWVQGERRFLQRPFFAGGLQDLKATLLVESPVAFRRRMLFVGRDVLDRPRRLSAAGDRRDSPPSWGLHRDPLTGTNRESDVAIATMRFLAHTENANGIPHLLRDHLQAVGNLASAFAGQNCPPLSDAAYWAGLLHDLGKYRDEFQEYLVLLCHITRSPL